MAKKSTRPERPNRVAAGPLVKDRPASADGGTKTISPATDAKTTATSARNRRGANAPVPPKKPKNRLKVIRENLLWGAIIGLPILLVVLALLSKFTNGFDFSAAPTPFPTQAPSPTAGVFQTPAPPAAASPTRLLYLNTADSGPNNIYAANADGSNAVKLTNTSDIKSTPSWSHDGKYVIFAANNVGVQMVNYDGTNLHTLAYNGFDPVWSPDGKSVAFLREDASGSGNDLFVIAANGKPGDEKELASNANGPSWSPDSKTIAYFDLQNAVMFTVDVSNPAAVNQIKGPASKQIGGWFPTFTPDGKNIIFYGSPHTSEMVGALSSGINPLTPAVSPTILTPNAAATTPASTPSGTPAASGTPTTVAPTATPVPVRAQIGLYQVAVNDTDGSTVKQLTSLETVDAGSSSGFATFVAAAGENTSLLTTNPSFRAAPVYSPDGKRVATLEVGKTNPGLEVVTLDGSAQPTIISSDNGLDNGLRLNPTFSQDGQQLLYLFIPSGTNQKTSIRAYNFSTGKETTVVGNGDNAFVTCCGFGSK